MVDPVLSVVRARIDVGGSPAVDGLSLETTGERALVLGAARALFEAAAGLLPLAHGELRIRTMPPLAAVRGGEAAGAPLDPPLPAAWTPREYATWSARLAGQRRAEALRLAADAVTRLKMGPAADAPLRRAALAVRRATVLAAAMATGAKVVLLEDPVVGLAEDVARNLARAIVQALDDRAWVLFAGRLPLASPLAMVADEAIVVTGSQVAAQGNPAEVAAHERTYAVNVHGEGTAFAKLVEQRGGRVTGSGQRLTVELGERLEVRDLLSAAAEAQATLLEVVPLSGALS